MPAMTLDTIKRIREVGDKLMDPELTEQIFEEMADGLLLVDHRGIIQLLNRQCELLFGYHRSELFDKPLEMLLPSSRRDSHRSAVAGYFSAPRRRPMGIGRLDLKGRRKDGSEFDCEIMLGPIVTYVDTYCLAAIRLPRGGTYGATG